MEAKRPSVLITGATGKLGRNFALGFSAMNCNVAFTTRGGEAARKLEQECRDRGASRVTSVQVDLTSEDAPSLVAARLAAEKMLPEILVNNARDMQHLQVAGNGRTLRADWFGELLLGVVLPYELTMTLAELPDTPLRTVINIASIYGISAANPALYQRPEQESPINYGVAKAALLHLTKELAVRLAHRNVAVNAVSYGGLKGRVDKALQDRYGRLCPSGRMLEESEVFGAVKFLSSPDASGMTGHNLVVDGGWTIW